MFLFLVHHGDAIAADVDSRRPLSEAGLRAVEELAEQAAARGVRPVKIWHSGKLRARQTAEIFWRLCNPFAEFTAVRGLQPADMPQMLRDSLLGENRDVMVVGHMPNIARVLALLTSGEDADAAFPPHGLVALDGGPRTDPKTDDPAPRTDERELWAEGWRLECPQPHATLRT
jgi:phosphohistidine phosphatase